MAMSVVYTTVNGQILSESRGGTVSHFVPDPLGSVVMVRDTSGNTVYEAEYDPYGNVQSETGTNPSSLGYVGTLGYIKDSAASMYVRARYLLNNLGRWLTKDPLWPNEPGYVYSKASPTYLVDIFGLAVVIPASILLIMQLLLVTYAIALIIYGTCTLFPANCPIQPWPPTIPWPRWGPPGGGSGAGTGSRDNAKPRTEPIPFAAPTDETCDQAIPRGDARNCGTGSTSAREAMKKELGKLDETCIHSTGTSTGPPKPSKIYPGTGCTHEYFIFLCMGPPWIISVTCCPCGGVLNCVPHESTVDIPWSDYRV
jgi:RHS repeat-associated protein